jgi:hypothetical protein
VFHLKQFWVTIYIEIFGGASTLKEYCLKEAGAKRPKPYMKQTTTLRFWPILSLAAQLPYFRHLTGENYSRSGKQLGRTLNYPKMP